MQRSRRSWIQVGVNELIRLDLILEGASRSSRARVLGYEEEGPIDRADDMLRELVKLGLEMEEDGRRLARSSSQFGQLASVVGDFAEVVRAGREVGDGVDDGGGSGGDFALRGGEAFGEGVGRGRLTDSSGDASEDLDGKDGVLGVEVLERRARAIEASKVSAKRDGSARRSSDSAMSNSQTHSLMKDSTWCSISTVSAVGGLIAKGKRTGGNSGVGEAS